MNPSLPHLRTPSRPSAFLALVTLLLAPRIGFAQPSSPTSGRPATGMAAGDDAQAQPPPQPAPPARDARDEAPRLGLVESPFGMRSGTFMAGLTGTKTSAKSSNEAEGGAWLGFSPLSRLTVHGLVGRDAKGSFSPVLTGHVRLLGSLEERFALGLLAQYKTEGFSELGGEAEIGVTMGGRLGRFSAMSNLVVGAGVEEKEAGEVDGEAKLRVGYDVVGPLRLGAEGQIRRRFAGDQRLAGGRQWDALGGPQVMLLAGPAAVAVSGGATTTGVAAGVGTFGMATVVFLTR